MFTLAPIYAGRSTWLNTSNASFSGGTEQHEVPAAGS
jgi:hypothetical protein